MTMKDKQRRGEVKPITVYLPKDIHREVERAAKEGHRSLSAQVVSIVEQIVWQQRAAK